jgi:DNA-binding SARP family transcriptional activator/tetratricopeptide (TPR) repeat protein
MRFGVLGTLLIHDGDAAVRVTAARQRVLLATMLVRAPQPVPLDELIEMVWDGAPPDGAAATVRAHIMRLRRALGPRAGARLLTRPPGYLINADEGELDLLEFSRRCHLGGAAVRAGSWADAWATLTQALALWRGSPLADIPSQLLRRDELPRLEQLRLQAIEGRADAGLHLGRHAELVPELESLVATHPLRERFHAQLMLALYRCSRQAEALAVYQDARRALVEELGMEPGSELRQLHQLILGDDPDLAVPGQAPQAVHGSGHLVPRQLPAPVRPFAGRDRELAALNELMEPAGESAAAVVISAIGGTAGVGKTALAVHWAHRIAAQYPDGQLYVNLRGFDPSTGPVQSAEALRGFLDALGVPTSQIPAKVEGQAALYRSLLASRKMLVVLDNARDVGQVRPLLPGNPSCLTVVTSRNKLAGLIAVEGATPLSLDVLAQPEARALLASRLGDQRLASEPDAADEVIALCTGLPLAIAICAARVATSPSLTLAGLASMLRSGGRRLDAMSTDDAKASLQAVFACSYRNLSGDAARMFRLLGLHPGPDITVPAAASLAGTPADTAHAVMLELAAGSLLTEHRQGRFALHDLLRVYAADCAAQHDSQEERHAAVHRMLDHYLHTAHAAAQELNRYRDGITLVPAQPGVTSEHFTSDQQSLAWFDAEQAVLLALADHAAAGGFDMHAWQLPWALGTFLDRRGRWDERLSAQLSALGAAERLGDKQAVALVDLGLGEASTRLGAYQDALAYYGTALELFGRAGDDRGQGLVHLGIASTFYRLARYSDALWHCEQALQLDSGDRAWRAKALNNIGWCHAQFADYQQALECCEQALVLHQDLSDTLGAASTHDTIGYALHHLGRYREAAAALQQALVMFRELGDRSSEAVVLTHLGDAYRTDGQPGQASDAWRQALAILRDLKDANAEDIRARLASLRTASARNE